MSDSPQQIPMPLTSKEPFAVRYFVFHSGVAESVSLFDEYLSSRTENPSGGSFFVRGFSGVGKTHFICVAKERALQAGVPAVHVFDDLSAEICADTHWCSHFISVYQHALAHGEVVLLGSRFSPEDLASEAGVRSRMNAAQQLFLRNPNEHEIEPIIHSLAERRNLVLSDKKVQYIVRRLPRNPLSYEHLFATIDRLCLTSGKSAGLRMFKSVIDDSRETTREI